MSHLRLTHQAKPTAPAAGRSTLYIDEADGILKQVGNDDVAVAVALGSPTFYSFAFAFDDVGLEDGLTVYTPSVGDGTVFLLDATVIVDEVFDGTLPLLDIGTGVGVATGLFYNALNAQPVALDYEDDEASGTGIQVGTANNYGIDLLGGGSGGGGKRVAYAPFTALNPLKLWVSQDGTIGGPPVGGTTGAGRLVFGIVTPIVL